MLINISRDDEFCTVADVQDVDAIPQCVFTVSQHYGSGDYVVRSARDSERFEAHEPIFRMKVEWLEKEVAA